MFSLQNIFCSYNNEHCSLLSSNYNNINKKKYLFEFSHYFAGLVEGDGTIITPKKERSEKGKLYYPSIQIVFNLKDLPLASKIKDTLGYGSLYRKKGINAYVLVINDFKGIISLVSVLNGKMRTGKIYDLWKLIDWLNNRFNNLNIIKYPLDSSSIQSNSWFSGFIDADGHFSVRTSKGLKYTKIECKFELCQSQITHNNINNLIFLEIIASFLLCTVKSIRLNRPKPEYRVRTTSLKGNKVLEEYLEEYPLFSSKYLDYKDWNKVLALVRLGEHKNELGINKIIDIKSGMNNKRTLFIWDHLQQFYSLNK